MAALTTTSRYLPVDLWLTQDEIKTIASASSVDYSNLQPIKSLLRYLFLYVRTAAISLDQYYDIVQLLLVRYTRQSHTQKLQQTVQKLVNSFNIALPSAQDESDEEEIGSKIEISKENTKSLAELSKYIENVCKKGLINRAEKKYIETLLQAKDSPVAGPNLHEESTKYDAGSEIQALKSLFPDNFQHRNRHLFEPKAIQAVLEINITANKQPDCPKSALVQVKVQIPWRYSASAACIISILDQKFVSEAELLCLLHLLEKNNLYKVQEKRFPTVSELLHIIQQFLQDIQDSFAVNSAHSSSEKVEFPYFPNNFSDKDLSTARLRVPTAQNESTLSLSQLNSAVIEAAKGKIKEFQGYSTNSGRVQPCFEISECENVLSHALISKFHTELVQLSTLHSSNQLKFARKQEFLYAQVAFHGTSCRSAINSIAQQGLLLPGSITASGSTVNINSGARYGEGIYTSPKFSKSLAYSWHEYDDNFQVRRGQMFVCLVILGRPYYVEDGASENQKYELFDSKISKDGLEFIVFNEARVLPVLLITYQPYVAINLQKNGQISAAAAQNSKETEEKEADREYSALIKRRIRQQFDLFRRKRTRKALSQGVWAELLPGFTDKWLISLGGPKLHKTELEPQRGSAEMKQNETESSEQDESPHELSGGDDFEALIRSNFTAELPLSPESVHLCYIIQRDPAENTQFEKVLAPGCSILAKTMSSAASQSVVYYGEGTEIHENIPINWFDSETAKKTGLKQGNNLAAALKLAIHLLVNKKIKENQRAEAIIAQKLLEEREDERDFIEKQFELAERRYYSYKECRCGGCALCIAYEEARETRKTKWQQQYLSNLRDIYRFRLRSSMPQQLFCFVLVSSGENRDNLPEIGSTLARESAYLQGNAMNSLYFAVNHSKADRSLLNLLVRSYLHTISGASYNVSTPFYRGDSTAELLNCFRNMQKELENLNNRAANSIEVAVVPQRGQAERGGFLRSLTEEKFQDKLNIVISEREV
jgi:hypothetical protein